jgi:succinate-semialdehyde dehydrogenase/glutarate-semialdehyde dehydrogenase
VSIEAGGNAPFIVFGDADIDKAVDGTFRVLYVSCSNATTGAIACKFRATGQTCVSANRIYVQSSVYADFACRLAERVTGFKVGDGLDEKT